MKLHLAVFVSVIAILFTGGHANSKSLASCGIECAPFIPGAVAYWPMTKETNGSDLSGNDNRATCVGLTYTDGPTNKYNGSAHFNGSRYSFASIANSPSMNIGKYPGFSFSGFIRYSGPQDAYVSLIDWSGKSKYGVFILTSSTKINLHLSPDRGNNLAVFSNLTLDRDKWHFIGISYNKTTGIATAFKDGIQEVKQLDKHIVAGSSKFTKVGLGIDLTDLETYNYKGDMSCMMLFKYALTADDYQGVRRFCQTIDSIKTMLPKITVSAIGTTRATASWTKSPGIFSGYRVTIERRHSEVGPEIVHPKFILSNTTTLQSALIDLVPGATYRVHVWHIQRDLIGRARSSEWFNTKSPLIVDVDSIVFSEITPTSASVSWGEVSGNFDNYTIEISPTTEGAKVVPSEVARGTTTTSLHNLSPGISYIITIRTKKGSRTSPPSMKSFQTLDLAKPNTINGLTIGLIILINVLICIIAAGITAYYVRYKKAKHNQPNRTEEAITLVSPQDMTVEVRDLKQEKSNLEADIEKLTQERTQQKEGRDEFQKGVRARLKCLKSLLDNKRNDKLESITNVFQLTLDQYKEVMQKMEDEMSKGLGKDTHEKATVKMFPTYVRNIPDGTERGNFLALDLGDTKLRVILISLLKDQQYTMKHDEYDIAQMKAGPGTKLFDYIAQCILEFVNKNEVKGFHLPLGFMFAFPCKQECLAEGRLVQWTKGFSCDGVVNEDVVRLLQNAINEKKLNVECIALINDNVGTLMACSYDHPDCKIGLTVGEGTNACYMADLSKVEKWEGPLGEHKQMIINTEWGAFGDNKCLNFIRTEYDELVDNNSQKGAHQIFEKMISGIYLGEIVRHVLVKLANEGYIFYCEVTKDLNTPTKFDTKYVAAIESEKYTNAKTGNTGQFETRRILTKMGYDEVTDEDCRTVQKVCSLVFSRAAYLVAAGIAALLNRIDSPHTTVVVDGSLFKDNARFTYLVNQKLRELVKTDKKWTLELSSEGSVKGAALVAAVAYRVKLQQQHVSS